MKKHANGVVQFTDSELSTIGSALDMAAERFRKEAAAPGTSVALVERFERQAAEYKELADRLVREH